MAFAFGGGGRGVDFNPRSVSLGPGQNNRIPYINNINWMRPRPITRLPHTPPQPINFDGGPAKRAIDSEDQGRPLNVLGTQAVRATGTGPYDSAYRQNLATYAGGQFTRPGGNLSFNPTGGLFGNPTGGGNAPVLGMPDSLVSQALNGNPFKFTPPPPPPPSDDGQLNNPLGWWRDQFLDNGRLFGGGIGMMNLE